MKVKKIRVNQIKAELDQVIDNMDILLHNFEGSQNSANYVNLSCQAHSISEMLDSLKEEVLNIRN